MENQTDSVNLFYNNLAASYHLLVKDWSNLCNFNGQIIDKIVDKHFEGRSGWLKVKSNTCGKLMIVYIIQTKISLLDCSCGIGTQVFGLQKRDKYIITASDISEEAIKRALQEQEKIMNGN